MNKRHPSDIVWISNERTIEQRSDPLAVRPRSRPDPQTGQIIPFKEVMIDLKLEETDIILKQGMFIRLLCLW